MTHRQNLAVGAYYKHRAVLQSRTGLALRLHAWMSTPGSVALHGSESWHITASNMQAFQTWEYQQLRHMFKLRRKPEEDAEVYNKRTASCLRQWFSATGTCFSTHRILKKLYKDAWLEKASVLPCGDNPLRACREFRSEQWWQTLCQMSSQYKRRKLGLQHRNQGHRPAWEDIFCKVSGIHWRHERDAHSSLNTWMAGFGEFLPSACEVLGIAFPSRATLPAAPDTMYTYKDKCTFAVIPDAPPHPDDSAWDTGGKRLWIQVDCKGVADVSNGDAVLQAPHLEPLFQRTSDTVLRLCEHGWRPRRDTDDLIIWAPREYNVVADHLANAAMDCGSGWYWEDAQGITDALKQAPQFKVCVDGGLRRSSGDAAMAVAIFIVRQGAYIPVLYSAQPLKNLHSAFQAEAHSLELALTILSQLFSRSVA